MPLPTPFHLRTAELNQGQEWRHWSGYLGAGVYEMFHEREYWAIRNAAALIDVSPLFKYEFTGPDAERALNRIMTRDMTKCRVGQVMYTPWCDDEGKVIDDGTVSRLGEQHFRVTSADPSWRWFKDCAWGMDVEIRDVSTQIASLALQGPNSRAVLESAIQQFSKSANQPISHLKYYYLTHITLADIPVTVTRTGYTGDLGYELWFAPEHAVRVWDYLMDAGMGYGIMPAGLAALDISRIEAGLVLIEVDYLSSPRTFITGQKSSPFEIGLGWAVKFAEGKDFVGRKALEAEAKHGSTWATVGLEIDWVSLEKIYGAKDLPVQVTGRSNRSSVPLYVGHRQVGYVTSHTFSPILKRYIGLATLETQFAKVGTELEMEFTVEHHRERGRAVVGKLPFYEPEWKKG
ncbi:MAG TPA: aminomethyltransferase family protein [Anaerolineales bacterium]|nr:aminomethyltransferase family protein [Anaerolineales bacterium]